MKNYKFLTKKTLFLVVFFLFLCVCQKGQCAESTTVSIINEALATTSTDQSPEDVLDIQSELLDISPAEIQPKEIDFSSVEILSVDADFDETTVYYKGDESFIQEPVINHVPLTEDFEKRLANQIFLKDSAGKEYSILYFSNRFFKQNGKWFNIEVATTSQDIQISKNSFWDFLISPVYADTSTTTTAFDTFISKYDPDYVFGNDTILDIYYRSDYLETVLISATLPTMSGYNLTGVDLFLYKTEMPNSGSGKTLDLYPGLRAWVEDQATWNIFSTGNNWTTAGCLGAGTDYTNAVIDTISPDTAVDTWVSFTIEGAGASGTSLDLDFGDDINLVIRGSSEDERIDVSYASNQYVDDITKRPYLLLTYAAATTTPPATSSSQFMGIDTIYGTTTDSNGLTTSYLFYIPFFDFLYVYLCFIMVFIIVFLLFIIFYKKK